jgi:hypothetical protein
MPIHKTISFIEDTPENERILEFVKTGEWKTHQHSGNFSVFIRQLIWERFFSQDGLAKDLILFQQILARNKRFLGAFEAILVAAGGQPAVILPPSPPNMAEKALEIAAKTGTDLPVTEISSNPHGQVGEKEVKQKPVKALQRRKRKKDE